MAGVSVNSAAEQGEIHRRPCWSVLSESAVASRSAKPLRWPRLPVRLTTSCLPTRVFNAVAPGWPARPFTMEHPAAHDVDSDNAPQRIGGWPSNPLAGPISHSKNTVSKLTRGCCLWRSALGYAKSPAAVSAAAIDRVAATSISSIQAAKPTRPGTPASHRQPGAGGGHQG